MNDILDAINAVHRTVGRKTIPAGDSRTVVMRRTYHAELKDVWDALTSPERLSRWFVPVTGDLRLGGNYQLTGNAHGEILECEAPHRLKVSWLYGENTPDQDIGEVEVRLEPSGDATTLVLEHAGVVLTEKWEQYGAGAKGVGWDLGLLGLDWHLRGVEVDGASWMTSPEAKEAVTRSAQAWGEASLAAEEPADAVARQVASTTEVYTG